MVLARSNVILICAVSVVFLIAFFHLGFKAKSTIPKKLSAEAEAFEEFRVRGIHDFLGGKVSDDSLQLSTTQQLSTTLPTVVSSTQAPLTSSQRPSPAVTSATSAKLKSSAAHHLAIVVPYRDREENLKEFVKIISGICQQQSVDYRIFVIEQTSHGAFNRAKLCNIGYKVASALGYDYFVFHDVDKVPVSAAVSYRWHGSNPKHMAYCVAQFGYRLPYGSYIGGVLMMTGAHYAKINGMSNRFWGWGGEDDEVNARFSRTHLSVERDSGCDKGKFRSLQHGAGKKKYPGAKYDQNIRVLNENSQGKVNFREEGLSSLEYDLIKKEDTPQFSRVTVDVCKGDLGRSSPSAAACDVS